MALQGVCRHVNRQPASAGRIGGPAVVGDKGDAYKPELVIRELDMDRIKEVRDGWAFYRDRRPDAYDEIVEG